MKILSLPIEKEAHLRTKKVIIHFEILTSLIQKAKLFNQFNNKELLNSKNKKMCVTQEEVNDYRYELVLRNKYELVVKTEGQFAYGTNRRNKDLFDESKVVIENIPSFSMKGNDKSENEELIDTSASSSTNKRKRNQRKKKETRKKAGRKKTKSNNKKKKK